jgi:HK97 gp10 family phage protein
MDVKFELLGADQINAKLKAVTDDVKRKSGRAALRKAANVVLEAAKDNARGINDPETGRAIVDNIALRWNGKLFKQTGNLGFRIGVLQGAKLPPKGSDPDTGAGGPTPHWRLVEFGTVKMMAQPFMRPALSNNIGAATAVFIKEYGKGLDRAIRRAAKGK